MNGDVVRTLTPANKPTKAGGFSSELAETLPLKTSSWVAVRCFDQPLGNRFHYAHSAAHYEIDGPVRPKRREVAYFIERMTQEISRNRKRWLPGNSPNMNRPSQSTKSSSRMRGIEHSTASIKQVRCDMALHSQELIRLIAPTNTSGVFNFDIGDIFFPESGRKRRF